MGGIPWRGCKAGIVLWAEVDADFPGRRRSSDGMIGDAEHRAEGTGSDHNPNKDAVVLALDLSNDPGTFDAHQLMDWLLVECREGRENRVKYLISNGRYADRFTGWRWATYYGDDPHDTHAHVSFVSEPSIYDDARLWLANYPPANGTEFDMPWTPEEKQFMESLNAKVDNLSAGVQGTNQYLTGPLNQWVHNLAAGSEGIGSGTEYVKGAEAAFLDRIAAAVAAKLAAAGSA